MIESFAILAESENEVDRDIAAELALGNPELVSEALRSGRLYSFPVIFGVAPDDVCGRKGCDGTIVGLKFDGSCCCHTGCAPCSWCTSGCIVCSKCDFEEEYHC